MTVHGVAEPASAGPTTAQLHGGLSVADDWMLTGQFDLPFAGAKREDWRVGLGVRWSLGAADDAADCGCEGEEADTGCAGDCGQERSDCADEPSDCSNCD